MESRWKRDECGVKVERCPATTGLPGRARAPKQGPIRASQPARWGLAGSSVYLRMLCASMLRFWLLEHTTATRSGADGMAGTALGLPAPPSLNPGRRSTKWRRQRGGRGRDASAGPRRGQPRHGDGEAERPRPP